VHLYDTSTGRRVRRLEGHQGEVKALTFSPDGRRLASGSLDTTVLVWDATGLARQEPRSAPLAPKELEALGSALAGADAARAHRAVGTLETLPGQAVPLLAERLRRPQPDATQVASLVKQLDSEEFAARQRAAGELRKLHWIAEPALRRALEETNSLEVRQRAKELLQELSHAEPPSELLQDWRAVEVLERIGTPEAKEALRELADRMPATRLTREAKAALERLDKRAAASP
jgi:hypothetical protein